MIVITEQTLEIPPNANAFAAQTDNVAGLTLDLPAMNIELDRSISGEIEGQGPLTLTLKGNWQAPDFVRVTTLSGAPVSSIVVRRDMLILSFNQLNGISRFRINR